MAGGARAKKENIRLRLFPDITLLGVLAKLVHRSSSFHRWGDFSLLLFWGGFREVAFWRKRFAFVRLWRGLDFWGGC
jgi:hypothetical protein